MKMQWDQWVVAGVVTLLAGCLSAMGYFIYQDATEPESGVVTKVEYVQPWVSTTCSTVGNSTICTPVSHPECYRIEYDHGDDWGDACVSPVEYQTYRVGDHFPKER